MNSNTKYALPCAVAACKTSRKYCD